MVQGSLEEYRISTHHQIFRRSLARKLAGQLKIEILEEQTGKSLWSNKRSLPKSLGQKLVRRVPVLLHGCAHWEFSTAVWRTNTDKIVSHNYT